MSQQNVKLPRKNNLYLYTQAQNKKRDCNQFISVISVFSMHCDKTGDVSPWQPRSQSFKKLVTAAANVILSSTLPCSLKTNQTIIITDE